MNRGEIRWYTFRQPDKRRPVLILSRNEVTDHLNEIIVVPVTRTIRGRSSNPIALCEHHDAADKRRLWVILDLARAPVAAVLRWG